MVWIVIYAYLGKIYMHSRPQKYPNYFLQYAIAIEKFHKIEKQNVL